ncbi:TetR-like C-terminal domain-containing protein [Paenibacillus sp. GCM10023250]|uniref:TetR-like C-terminal domain-containing protein n=1 Tax=Paenibacillus sp. GCM10023250 TaxID=3252648 RepID=UPI00361CBC35
MEEIIYPDDGINHELFTIYSLHALLGIVFHWVENGFRYTPDYMQEQLVRLITKRQASAAILRTHH